MCCLKNIWVWLAIIAGVIATFLITGTANAGVSIVSQTPVYNEVKNYETVEVCTPGTKGNPLGGALLGGIIGNNTGDGDAAAGAIIGGILGGTRRNPCFLSHRKASEWY